ncbi:MAG: hypothetical protein PVJ39_13465 [Gammaproteobacteria bacterium]|jgi:hypothetical protein
MNYKQLHHQAEQKWSNSLDIRRRYPTFVFYWHEQYERIYNIPSPKKPLEKLLNGLH